MESAWFNTLADELARCLTDAEACADACEALLEAVRDGADEETRRVVLAALVAPAAIARVLIDLIDQPAQLVLAACRLCHESSTAAIGQLEALDGQVDSAAALQALRASAASCERLLDAVN
jgi:hypothetical protein